MARFAHPTRAVWTRQPEDAHPPQHPNPLPRVAPPPANEAPRPLLHQLIALLSIHAHAGVPRVTKSFAQLAVADSPNSHVSV
jgi:hypothetical protein